MLIRKCVKESWKGGDRGMSGMIASSRSRPTDGLSTTATTVVCSLSLIVSTYKVTKAYINAG